MSPCRPGHTRGQEEDYPGWSVPAFLLCLPPRAAPSWPLSWCLPLLSCRKLLPFLLSPLSSAFLLRPHSSCLLLSEVVSWNHQRDGLQSWLLLTLAALDLIFLSHYRGWRSPITAGAKGSHLETMHVNP